VGLDIAAVQANVGQHAVIKGFEALLHPAAMRVHANFTNHVADPAHQVEAGTITHFNSAVCDYDDHCIHSFKASCRERHTNCSAQVIRLRFAALQRA
jgi:hypothetical protein